MCLGGFVVAFSMISLFAREKLYINEVFLGTTFGISIGPHVANIFNPRGWVHPPFNVDNITLEVMRITLATGLFAIGVQLPGGYMYKRAKSLLVMIVPTMAVGWIIVSAILKSLFPSLGFLACLATASCLTPTDPIISAAIVGGRFAEEHVEEELRDLISAESAANDGLAYPFLTFAIYLTVDATVMEGIKDWILIGILYQVVLGIVIGAMLGWLFSKLMKYLYELKWLNEESYVVQYLALAIFTEGLVVTIGSDDLLASFAAGCAISWDGGFKHHTQGQYFAALVDFVLNCACFIYIGAWLPFESFYMPELGITPPRLVILSIAILFARRIPALLMLYKWIPEIRDWREALFTCHFGPMSVGAIFVSTLALHKLPSPKYPPETQQDCLALMLQPIVTFVVLSSIIIHGLSIPLLNLGRSLKPCTSDELPPCHGRCHGSGQGHKE
ncbi:Cation/H+ exchanger [Amanita rubescens]|nr:Cation/H+ exchanger [Amanita rubescens]